MPGLSAIYTSFFNAVVTVWNVLHNLDPVGLSQFPRAPLCFLEEELQTSAFSLLVKFVQPHV